MCGARADGLHCVSSRQQAVDARAERVDDSGRYDGNTRRSCTPDRTGDHK